MQKRCLNIAIAVPRLEIGGLETVLKSLASHFTAAGHIPTFIETESKGAWSDEFRSLNFSVVTLAVSPFDSAVGHARRVGCELRKYDVVWLNDAPYAQSALGLMRCTSVAIPILHLPIPSFRRNAAGNPGEWETIVSVSPGLMKALVEMDHVPASRVTCIPNGVNVAPEWPRHSHDFTSTLPLRILHIGRIEDEQKGVMHLPGIARRLRDRNVDFEMDIVGDGPHLSLLKREIAAQCKGCRIVFHGAVRHKDVPGLLAQHDVIVMPSYFEGLPIALLEAMAAGVVPVASRLEGQTDFIVSSGENGLLAEVGSEDGFAEALASVAADRNALHRLSRNAWSTVRDRFSAEAMGKAYEATMAVGMARRADAPPTARSGNIDRSMLGDMPGLPALVLRPLRKALRVLGLWPQPGADSRSMREWATGPAVWKDRPSGAAGRCPETQRFEDKTLPS